MNVAVSGSSGLIGSALVRCLTRSGHRVTRLVRRRPRPGKTEVYWDPAAGEIDRAGLEAVDAVVHLAGESIAGGRWTSARKERIRSSRVQGTRLLAQALSHLAHPPEVLISASAVGYYGNRGDEVLREESPPGSGFLPQLCRQWEAATGSAAGKGIRVVILRMGMVLARSAGALPKMLTPFRFGLGGKIGSGAQYVSWISIDDLVGVIPHVIANRSIKGPVNAVSPKPVTNLDFTATLGRVLNRPAFVSVPPFIVRLVLGEMGDALFLTSARVEPARLKASGYAFRHPELEGALRHLLNKPAP